MKRLELIDKFEKMWCPLVYKNDEGEYLFPNIDIIHGIKYKNIYDDLDYNLLNSKMNNLIILLNEDDNNGYLDFDKILWDKI